MSSSEHSHPAAAKSTGRDKEGLSKTSPGAAPSSNTGKTRGWGRRDDGGWGVFVCLHFLLSYLVRDNT